MQLQRHALASSLAPATDIYKLSWVIDDLATAFSSWKTHYLQTHDDNGKRFAANRRDAVSSADDTSDTGDNAEQGEAGDEHDVNGNEVDNADNSDEQGIQSDDERDLSGSDVDMMVLRRGCAPRHWRHATVAQPLRRLLRRMRAVRGGDRPTAVQVEEALRAIGDALLQQADDAVGAM
jgi:hypothetical protein